MKVYTVKVMYRVTGEDGDDAWENLLSALDMAEYGSVNRLHVEQLEEVQTEEDDDE